LETTVGLSSALTVLVSTALKRLGGLVAGEHVAKSRATAPVAMIHTVTTSFEHDEVRRAGDGADSKGSTSIALGSAGASKSFRQKPYLSKTRDTTPKLTCIIK